MDVGVDHRRQAGRDPGAFRIMQGGHFGLQHGNTILKMAAIIKKRGLGKMSLFGKL